MNPMDCNKENGAVLFSKKKRKGIPLRFAAGFRILLWWGAEIARGIFVYKKPKAQIVRLSVFNDAFPVSSWVFTSARGYCLFYLKDQAEVNVYPLPGMEKN